jgi:hypothetical protein
MYGLVENPAPSIKEEKMRKLSLENYFFERSDEKGQPMNLPYNVKLNLIACLFQRQNNLNAIELLERDDLARKIRGCKENEILLEEIEYNKIKQAIDIITGYGEDDIEFVKRIFKCPQIEVEEKKEKGGKQTG